jgi:hypothetical protein
MAADKDIIIICLMTMLFSLFINAKRFEEGCSMVAYLLSRRFHEATVLQ